MSSRSFRHIDPGINVVPQTSSNVAVAGDIDFSSNTNKFNGFNGTIASPFVLEATTATLTNKTIAAGSNTITGLTNANLSGSAGITGANIASSTIAGSNVQTNTIANSNLTQMATHTIKGNASGSTANVSDLTGTQVTALLDNMVGDSGSGGTKGLVPAPAAGDAAANKFLMASGSWANVTGQGVTTIGTIDSQTASVNGAVIVPATTLIMQSASATRPGLVNNTNQTMAGAKTFQTSIKTPIITDNSAGLIISSTAGQDLKLQGTSSGSLGRLILEGQNGTDFRQVSTPSGTPANYDTFYFKSDDKPYYKTNGGTEYQFQRALTPTTQVLTDSGTYTTPANISYLKVTIVGAGGGGGDGGGGVYGSGGGGGGSGGTAIVFIPSPSSSYSYSVGIGGTHGVSDGGTTTFDIYSATGGAAGQDGTINSISAYGFGGDGGLGSGGNINFTGNAGNHGSIGSVSASPGAGGVGGGSFFGGAGAGGSSGGNGSIGQKYGGGGGGGCGASAIGGNGFDGVIIVEEYYK